MQSPETPVPTGPRPRSPHIAEGVTLSVAPMMDCGDSEKNVLRPSNLRLYRKSV